ncbi:antitoxin [Clostridia bacterium]|nr:antitoxin [Clostridia bacterium]
MDTAKLFNNGRSQAVRLPKECRFPGNEVGYRKVGDMVILFPPDRAWDIFKSSFGAASDDFMRDGRAEYIESKREHL